MTGALLLAGCSTLPTQWDRVDSAPVVPAQLQADELACKGDTEKAAVEGQARSTIDGLFGTDRQDTRIYVGCMAGKGYLAR